MPILLGNYSYLIETCLPDQSFLRKARHHEPVDRIGYACVLIACCDALRLSLDRSAGLPHRDGKARAAKHCHVVGLITDHRNFV